MTFYQKVKKALRIKGPTTYPNLADHMGADEEAVRLQLRELLKRGKATRHPAGVRYERSELWNLR